MNRAPTIQTFTGQTIDFLDPDPATINIMDISHSLSLINRYAGHSIFPYSVAQHSVLASFLAPKELKLETLLHDAHEAYVGDVPTTLKRLIPDYQVIEDRMESVVRAKFGLAPPPMNPEVKKIDTVMLVTEAQKFGFSWWPLYGVEPDSGTPIEPWTWRYARNAFRERFHYLAAEWA